MTWQSLSHVVYFMYTKELGNKRILIYDNTNWRPRPCVYFVRARSLWSLDMHAAVSMGGDTVGISVIYLKVSTEADGGQVPNLTPTM